MTKRRLPLDDLVACMGLSSRTPDHQHVLFWDLDYPHLHEAPTEHQANDPDHDPATIAATRSLQQALDGLHATQREHDLPFIEVFNAGSPTSWHAICPQKVPELRVRPILETHPDHDPQHLDVGQHLTRWILLFSPKTPDEPYTHTYTVHPVDARRPDAPETWNLSTPHLRFLHKVLGAPDRRHHPAADDQDGPLRIEHYVTPKTRDP